MALIRAVTSNFQQQLLERRAVLHAALIQHFGDEDARQYAAANTGVPDRAETAATDVAVDIALDTLRRNIEELERVDAALTRLTEGTFGLCSDCGAPIARARLFADPAVLRCTACQEHYEGRGREARDRTPSL